MYIFISSFPLHGLGAFYDPDGPEHPAHPGISRGNRDAYFYDLIEINILFTPFFRIYRNVR